MRRLLLVFFCFSISCWAKPPAKVNRLEAEYYVAAYARHYGVPLDFARAIVEQESNWHTCAVSDKGAVGLMQLMPRTAKGLGVGNRCDVKQNVSGGIRYLAMLMERYRGDLRLVAAAYYAGAGTVDRRGLAYGNRDVVAYVVTVRKRVQKQRQYARAAAGRER